MLSPTRILFLFCMYLRSVEIDLKLNKNLIHRIFRPLAFAGICLITCLLLLSAQERKTIRFSTENENSISFSVEKSILDDVQSMISSEETENSKKNPVIFIHKKSNFQSDKVIEEYSVNLSNKSVQHFILIHHCDLPPPSIFA